MARILLAVLVGALVGALVTACGNPGTTETGVSKPQAKAFKSVMDAEAEQLLPDLATALGGELRGMQATFYERAGFGLWDYLAYLAYLE